VERAQGRGRGGCRGAARAWTPAAPPCTPCSDRSSELASAAARAVSGGYAEGVPGARGSMEEADAAYDVSSKRQWATLIVVA